MAWQGESYIVGVYRVNGTQFSVVASCDLGLKIHKTTGAGGSADRTISVDENPGVQPNTVNVVAKNHSLRLRWRTSGRAFGASFDLRSESLSGPHAL